MENNVIKDYTWGILKRQLQKYKISNKVLYDIIDNVNMQLASFIKNYHDIEFRNTLLIIGSEEGFFYEPHNVEIANMVVVTIRNSLLEGVASDSYLQYGSNYYLDDLAIKDITKEAIIYFQNIDLDELSKTIEIEYDYYKEISKEYPVAMKALYELSKCNELNLEHEYDSIVKEKYELEELNNIKSDEKKLKNIESGIESSFNDSLCNFLNDIKEGNSKIFLVDCFKMATRNFEKLLKILEFILTHDAYFLTSNYFISNNYVSRRKDLLRAAHTTEESKDKKDLIPDISNKYKQILEYILKEE